MPFIPEPIAKFILTPHWVRVDVPRPGRSLANVYGKEERRSAGGRVTKNHYPQSPSASSTTKNHARSNGSIARKGNVLTRVSGRFKHWRSASHTISASHRSYASSPEDGRATAASGRGSCRNTTLPPNPQVAFSPNELGLY